MSTSTTEMAHFSEHTRAWLAEAHLAHRKRHGQYMTPSSLREALIDQLDFQPGMRVLDPGVGTGEFLRSVLEREPSAKVYGWDVDADILAVANKNVPDGHFEKRDALVPYTGEPFDLVIGNPPYFQFKAERAIRSHYSQVISGRVNIFSLFFQVGLSALRLGGQLGYVVPPSMNNGAYFDALRNYLTTTARIEWLKVFNDHDLFADAQTSVQLIVLRAEQGKSKHLFNRREPSANFSRTIFSQHPEKLRKQFDGRSTLYELGYESVTGTVVWNQNKDSLHRTPGPGRVPLIWAQNISDGCVVLQDMPKRPQYVETNKVLRGPAIVVNRIVGSVGSASFRCGLVPDGMEFVGENHVNVIRPRKGTDQKVPWDELLTLLSVDEISSRARLVTGNTQISATELNHLLPLGV
ncbi:MAG: class I SAM-dependent methyltransferase [Actinomycetota bacterium]|nr:class I SAM-dependent methyltransferase [Actinomycetota bacterium]